jgi:glycosyltransferase involved in cell wall biosynthesis
MDWVGAGARERSQLRLMGLARRRCARRVVVVSESARTAYLATGWDRPERVVTVHNGVTGDAVPGAGRAVREELGIAPDAPVVLVLAALRPEKAHDVAFEAAARLAERFPGLRLLVAGDGPLRPDIERLAARYGDLAAMAGYRADVMAVLDAADVVLQPSHIDAFPTTLLEAAAASVPVVATGVGGIPEIVIDGETGVLVEPPPDAGRVEEALGRVLADEDLRRRLGAAARRRYEREFTLDRWVARTRTVYESVLNGA